MAKKKAKKSAGKKRKPNAAFMKPMTPDSTLAAVIGSSGMPRTEVTKKIWAYIKRNGLQDKKNKRMINADDKLKSLFAGLEYRWPIWMWMDATLFAEYGGVFGPAFQGFEFSRMRPDVGGGVRMRSSESFYARAQVAYGWGDGMQAFFSVNTDF